jgi:hypothetical protein
MRDAVLYFGSEKSLVLRSSGIFLRLSNGKSGSNATRAAPA